MLEELISECTDYEFKESLEENKPKSWLKTISAFANGIGGSIFFGITNDKKCKNIDRPQETIEKITNLIGKHLSTKPIFQITPYRENNQTFIELVVSPGNSTPYYYVNEGTKTAFIRSGSSSIEAPDYILNELILKGKGQTYDGIITANKKDDYNFSTLEFDFLKRTNSRFENEDYVSFGLATKDGYITNAGILFADNNSIRQSRIFCTKWHGKDKTNEKEADDDKEFDGSIIRQLNLALDFYKVHTNVRWHKEEYQTIYEPDYSDDAILEALVNALIHRNYNALGAEVCLNIYEDRIEITSPGVMVSGNPIPPYVDYPFESMRRNPIIADLFWKMGYMNRRGSGLAKITNATNKLFHDDKNHVHFQIRNSFFVVTIENANYRTNLLTDLPERQSKIYKLLSENEYSLTELAAIFKVDRKTMKGDLTQLENKKLIKSKGKTKGNKWFKNN